MPRKSSFVDFKAVKALITMEQVLNHYNLLPTLKRKDDSLSGPCPIHKGSNPTQFRVNLTKNIWNCFSECKHGGNTLDFISRMENISIHAAALKAVDWFKLEVDDAEVPEKSGDEEESPAAPKQAKKPAPAPEPQTPNKPLQFRLEKLDRSHPYPSTRGLTQETVIDFGIGFCAKGVMADRIAIPIHSVKGEVVAYAGRWPGDPPEGTPKYKLPQGFKKSLELFNIDLARKEPPDVPLIIVEGFFDCMHLHQLGHRKVVALMGSSLSSAQEELLLNNTTPTSQIIVMLDEDEAGQAAREDIAVRLAKFVFVRIHSFEKEGMQPENLTIEELDEIVRGAK